MRIKPKKGHVLIEMLSSPESVGGIHIPESHRQASNEAIVRDIGDGPTELTPGSRIVVRSHDGQQLRYFGRNFRLVEERDVLAVIA